MIDRRYRDANGMLGSLFYLDAIRLAGSAAFPHTATAPDALCALYLPHSVSVSTATYNRLWDVQDSEIAAGFTGAFSALLAFAQPWQERFTIRFELAEDAVAFALRYGEENI